MAFDLEAFNIKKFDSILDRGLCRGKGIRGSQVCIEAAICETLGLPHGDDPGCVEPSIRAFKIRLNDSNWSSSEARAKGLRDLGIAQLGSKGVVDGVEFVKIVVEKTIRVLIPTLFREVFPNNKTCLAAADAAASAAHAADAAVSDRYLFLSAALALETLRELKSPGVELL